MLWKGFKVYMLLLLIFVGLVLYGNKEYIMYQIATNAIDPKKVNQYSAPAGTKEIKLEDVHGVDEAKEVRRSSSRS